MHYKEVFDCLDLLEEKYISFWEDVCNIESPTDDIKGVTDCCDYFVKRAIEFGWKVEKAPMNGLAADPVCITMNPDSKGTPISLSGHIDTVHPVGLFGSPAVKFDGDTIYGPGVCDCKGGVVAAFYAMEALHKIGFADRPIRLLLQTDEEVSSMNSKKATIKWICEKSKDSIAFLNLEGAKSANMLTVKRKGIITFLFKVSGVEAHSSLCAQKGANAIAEAAHKIIELEKFKDHEGLTASCNIISGGTKQNTVAGYCEFRCNVRYADNEQLRFIKKEAQRIADTVYVAGCKTELVVLAGRVAMPLNDRNLKLCAELNEAWENAGLPKLEAGSSNGGSDASDASDFGLAAVDCIGVRGGDIHSPNEYAYVSSLKQSAKRLCVACIYLK